MNIQSTSVNVPLSWYHLFFLLPESLASSFSSELSFLSLFPSFDSSYTDSISIQGFITSSYHWSGIRSQIVDPIFLIAQFFIRSLQSRSFDSTLIPSWEFAIAYKIQIPPLIHSRKHLCLTLHDPFNLTFNITLFVIESTDMLSDFLFAFCVKCRSASVKMVNSMENGMGKSSSYSDWNSLWSISS